MRAFFGRLVGTATKREIMDANPGMSQRTLERILSKLQNEGVVEKVGAARATAYRVSNESAAQGRVPDAFLTGKTWNIPSDAAKPAHSTPFQRG